MTRPLLLSTAGWADLSLEHLAPQAAEWGCQGLDVCCWADHFEVQRAAGEQDYCAKKMELLAGLELSIAALSVHPVSQVVCGPIDERHRALLPDYVWGDGTPEGVQQRAVEELVAAVHAAQQVGAAVLCGHTGSPLWPLVSESLPISSAQVDWGLADFAERWTPVLDTCRDCGIRYACVVRPGQIAFDYHSAEKVLEVVDGRPEFGFALDPAQLHWQGVDPVEFIHRFGDRLYHVLVTDAAITLNGRSSLLGSYCAPHDWRRGWQPRAPGRGGVDWEGIVRALNAVGYEGALAVDWRDPGMNRTTGGEEACRFIKRLDIEAPLPDEGQGYR